MQVFIAEPCGFCYGVKRAVEMARGECGKRALAVRTALMILQMAIRLFSVRTA